jgi:hypothetical protein
MIGAHDELGWHIALVEDYVARRARHVFAGVWRDAAAGGVVAAFTRDAERHRQSLEGLIVPEAGRVEVRLARWTRAELEALAERILDDAVDGRRELAGFAGIVLDLPGNRVVLGLASPAPQDEARIQDIYGEAVSVREQARWPHPCAAGPRLRREGAASARARSSAWARRASCR